MSKIKFSIILLLLLSFKLTAVLAQAPQKMSFQAVLRNSSSELIVKKEVGMRISILRGSENGSEVYVEVQKAFTNENGLVTLAVGTGTKVRGTFESIDWGNGPLFIKTETDPNGGAAYTISGISQFMSVPYALFAANSGGTNGRPGQSAFELWKTFPGNANKTEADFIESLRGPEGKSAFELWKEISGNENKTFTDFINSMTTVKGDKGDAGESAYDSWKKQPGNGEKTELDFINSLKGDAGESAFYAWKKQPGNGEKTELDFINSLKGDAGESAFDSWKKQPGNEEKTELDFINSLKGEDGKSSYDLWKGISGNENKSIEAYYASLMGANGKTIHSGTTAPVAELGVVGDFYINTNDLTFFGPKGNDGTWPAGLTLKGANGLGLDFKGSYNTLADYLAAGHEATLNKAYYNITDKKSYLFTENGWQVFAQDGIGGDGSGLNFNVDRNITRIGLPGAGQNLGAGKTTAQFLEEYFFPRLSATPPTVVLNGTDLDIPYSTWKNFPSFSTNLALNYTITNNSKNDDSEDKNINSIKLFSSNTEVLSTDVNNTSNPISGNLNNVVFANPNGSKTVDFAQSFQLRVTDEEPNQVNSNTLTAYMRKAIRLTATTPTITPSQLVYEYGTTDIPVTLNWTFNKNDETVKSIKVDGVNTGSTTTLSKQVIFKAVANGGAESQNYKVVLDGDIFGETTITSPTIKWEGNLYRGTISSSLAPCENGFNITDAQIHTGNTIQLGGTWKGDEGNDFYCDPSGKYVFYAYPDDSKAPVVEYYDSNFNVWQRYPSNQVKIIDRPNFVNASGYSGLAYKLVFVCVEYKSATVKIRIK